MKLIQFEIQKNFKKKIKKKLKKKKIKKKKIIIHMFFIGLGIGASLAHYLTERRQMRSAGPSTWQGSLLQGALSLLSPKQSVAEAVEEKIKAQVEHGMHQAASVLDVLFEQVAAVVDKEYPEIPELIAGLKRLRAPPPTQTPQTTHPDSPLNGLSDSPQPIKHTDADFEKQRVLSQTLVLLFSRNVSALLVLSFLLVIVHAQTQILQRYTALAHHHPFFAASLTPDLQRRFLAHVPREMLTRIAPMLVQRLKPCVDTFLQQSILSSPYRDASFGDVVDFFLALRSDLETQLQSLQHGLSGLLSVVPFSEDDALLLALEVELSQYLSAQEFVRVWQSVASDYLLHALRHVCRSPVAGRASFKLFQLIPVLREFFLHHFGAKPVEDAMHFNPSAPLSHGIPLQNEALRAFVHHVAGDISHHTFHLLDEAPSAASTAMTPFPPF